MRITEGGAAKTYAELLKEEAVNRRLVHNARQSAFEWVASRQRRLLLWWRQRNAMMLRERQGRAGVRQDERAARQDIVVRDRPPRARPQSAPLRHPRIAAEPPPLNVSDEKKRELLRAAKQKLDAGLAIQPGELAFLVIAVYDTTNTESLRRREWNTLLKHLGMSGNSGKVFAEACRAHGGDPHHGVTRAHLAALLGGKPGIARRITELLFPDEKTTFIGWNVAQFGKLPLCACSKVMTLVDLPAGNDDTWECRLCGRVCVGLRWNCPRKCFGADFCLQCNSLEWVSGGDKERMDAIGGWLLRQKQRDQQAKTGEVGKASISTFRDLQTAIHSGSSREAASELYSIKGRTLTRDEQTRLSKINEMERLLPAADQRIPSQKKCKDLGASGSAGLDPARYPLATLLKDAKRGNEVDGRPPPPGAPTRF